MQGPGQIDFMAEIQLQTFLTCAQIRLNKGFFLIIAASQQTNFLFIYFWLMNNVETSGQNQKQ